MQLYKDAVVQYNRATELLPDNASAHNGLAVCYYMLKDFTASKKHAIKAKQLGFKVDEKLLENK